MYSGHIQNMIVILGMEAGGTAAKHPEGCPGRMDRSVPDFGWWHSSVYNC